MSFRHKGLEEFFRSGSTRGIDAKHAAKLRRMLPLLSAGPLPESMNMPSYRLHQLKGNRKSEWAVSVSGNWRLVFEIHDELATNVDLVDYH